VRWRSSLLRRLLELSLRIPHALSWASPTSGASDDQGAVPTTQGRAVAALCWALSAIMTGTAYATSAEMVERTWPLPLRGGGWRSGGGWCFSTKKNAFHILLLIPPPPPLRGATANPCLLSLSCPSFSVSLSTISGIKTADISSRQGRLEQIRSHSSNSTSIATRRPLWLRRTGTIWFEKVMDFDNRTGIEPGEHFVRWLNSRSLQAVRATSDHQTGRGRSPKRRVARSVIIAKAGTSRDLEPLPSAKRPCSCSPPTRRPSTNPPLQSKGFNRRSSGQGV